MTLDSLIHARTDFAGREELGAFRLIRHRLTGEQWWEFAPAEGAEPTWHRITPEQLNDIGFCHCVQEALAVIARDPKTSLEPGGRRAGAVTATGSGAVTAPHNP